MNENTADKIGDLSNLGDLAKVDDLLASAASLISAGDYSGAVSCFEQVIEITHSIFGDNIELTEVKRKISEIQELLEEMKQNGVGGEVSG